MRLSLRDCRPGDITTLDQLNPSPSVRSFHCERFERQRTGTASYVLAWRRGCVVAHMLIKWDGCADADVTRRHPYCPEIACLEVFVPQLRGHGIGTRLIRHAEDRAFRAGFRHIGLGVAHVNQRAARLYARLGYHGTQRYLDRYRCLDSMGTVHEFAEPCVFLSKQLP